MTEAQLDRWNFGTFLSTNIILLGLTIHSGLSWWWWVGGFVAGWLVNCAIVMMARRVARRRHLKRLLEKEADEAWRDFCCNHILPSKLFAIAIGMKRPDAEQQSHLETCEICKRAFDRYQEV